ncbi:anti-anti-sigma regulatory factor (antagonist of anti-sigma factor) [Mycolicibacterium chubuense NBB4]|uniref:Anti-anti-sigma regulatory factor (Antagonist of anti-sigma factor) n=1 Tax=Mycolicibacterium chubuense (strain NBB4) TaxID=710421 RepID=I4BGM3_MYCCN|nr:STAS domain-containing protein [Mycolicibacterium chubuense]AFM16430.1 anti-anti-sigma regulatory factor (antagonist of anti-sigma factor) [Mycolicibacterium chubuense NBB4]
MATPLRLSTDRRDDGTVVLRAVGELDLSNIEIFSEALSGAVDEGAERNPVRVDLSAVDYLDSGAINVLFNHATAIDLVVNPILLPVLKISGLTDVIAVEPAPGA